jgi:4-methoxybenzoate monooxygenase (O-demethylating)
MTGMIETAIPESDLDPFSHSFLADPYPHHDILREAGPVVRLSKYGIFGLARYDEVRSVLLDWKTYCSSAGVGLANFRKEPPWRPPGVLLEVDPPMHDRTRGVLSRLLAPGILRTLQDTFNREADRLIGELTERGQVDAVTDLAERYPIKVFSDALGLPEEGRQHLLAYSNIGFNALGPNNGLFQDAMKNGAAAVEWVMAMCRRDALIPGGFGSAIYDAADAGELTEEEAFLIVRGFLTAGLDTTVSALGSAILCLANNPEQLALLRRQPSLARAAFEEAVRIESPVQTLFRTTTRAVEIGGVRIEDGEKIFLSVASANRDPRKWSEPARFNIARKIAGHVGYGAGIHVCAGMIIARMEGDAVLGAVARLVDRIELAGEPEYQLNNTLRGLSTLPITFHSARR